MVNLTRIYTRTGDAGETRLGDMSVTRKTDLRLAAYFAQVSEEVVAVWTRAVAEGKGHRAADEEFDEALERAGL